VNFDSLVAYMPHPGTTVYVGYNSNRENLISRPVPAVAGFDGLCSKRPGLVHGNGFINDRRQFFVKISYLFRR